MKRIKVLLVEDHTFVREGIRNMLELEDDLKVVGEAKDGRQAVAMVPEQIVISLSISSLVGTTPLRACSESRTSIRKNANRSSGLCFGMAKRNTVSRLMGNSNFLGRGII
jgi:DNA-binding NarL/FixJ family response regulator